MIKKSEWEIRVCGIVAGWQHKISLVLIAQFNGVVVTHLHIYHFIIGIYSVPKLINLTVEGLLLFLFIIVLLQKGLILLLILFKLSIVLLWRPLVNCLIEGRLDSCCCNSKGIPFDFLLLLILKRFVWDVFDLFDFLLFIIFILFIFLYFLNFIHRLFDLWRSDSWWPVQLVL